MTGNCLKGSRPLLSFDKNFEKDAHYALLKELFVQVNIYHFNNQLLNIFFNLDFRNTKSSSQKSAIH